MVVNPLVEGGGVEPMHVNLVRAYQFWREHIQTHVVRDELKHNISGKNNSIRIHKESKTLNVFIVDEAAIEALAECILVYRENIYME